MVTLRATTVFSGEKFTVTAIESLEVQTYGTDGRRHAIASVKPIAVIVKEPERSYALDMDAQALDIDQMELPADFKPE